MQIENKPGESSRLHSAIVGAFRAHWKSHDNKYPQKLIMPPSHERVLSAYFDPKEPGTYWGVAIEIDHASQGVMIAIDGTAMPFADYAKSDKPA